MTTKEEVKAIAYPRIVNHTIVAIICFCVNTYISSMPWASVALCIVGSVCLLAAGYLCGIVRTAEELTK